MYIYLKGDILFCRFAAATTQAAVYRHGKGRTMGARHADEQFSRRLSMAAKTPAAFLLRAGAPHIKYLGHENKHLKERAAPRAVYLFSSGLRRTLLPCVCLYRLRHLLFFFFRHFRARDSSFRRLIFSSSFRLLVLACHISCFSAAALREPPVRAAPLHPASSFSLRLHAAAYLLASHLHGRRLCWAA